MDTTDRYICIHGHFYQPPRENAWLEAIELQDSARPYHDWNARITDECYAPNAVSRILDGEEYIVQIVNNYASISFNVGPTLLAWLEAEAPDVYRAILEADRLSQERFGHGSALAQPYNHMIMPLANARDRRTQVRWGIRDFAHRFGRPPEGMWLPETAVDLETLEVMAAEGIAFTVLAPSQARRTRPLGGRAWRDVSGARIEPRRPYEARLPSGRRIAVFFYDGPISRAVAFERLLISGEAFAQRLLSAFAEDRPGPQLVHIATDGETYGHHHRFGDMALAYALHHIQANGLAQITNYAAYLAQHPPTHQVEVFEDTSWSCAHGVERWRSDCGCDTGGHPGWHQAWRGPLREALDWLRDALAPRYEQAAGGLLRDPWAARDDYIGVILDRSAESLDAFFGRHAARTPEEGERVCALKLLELQRHAMLMYTSCGWFFDELSGIETTQVLQYAGRALQLAQDLYGEDLEAGFLERLARAPSNIPEHGDGRRVYEQFVRPAMVDLPKVAAHYAISSLFDAYEERARVYCYTVDREDVRTVAAGRTRLAVGRVRVASTITRESGVFTYGVLHLGDHNVHGGVRPYRGEEAYARVLEDLTAAFNRAEIPEVIHLLDEAFEGSTYSIRYLFRDEQRRILDQILQSSLEDVTGSYRRIADRYGPLMIFLRDLGIPLPRGLRTAYEFTITTDLRQALAGDPIDPQRIDALLRDVGAWGVDLEAADGAELGYVFQQTLERAMARLRAEPDDLERLAQVEAGVALAVRVPFTVNLWRVQNVYYEMLQTAVPQVRERAAGGEGPAREWLERFAALGGRLRIRLPEPPRGS